MLRARFCELLSLIPSLSGRCNVRITSALPSTLDIRFLVRRGPNRIRTSSGAVQCVCLFEQPHVLRHVVATLLKGLWIPLASVGAEEVPTVDVNGASQSRDRICYRMDDVVTQSIMGQAPRRFHFRR
jgi:hypothetical protein